jgi:MFS family permease
MSLRNAVLIVTAIGYFISISRIAFSFMSRVSTNFMWTFSTLFMTLGLVMIILATSPTITFVGLLIAGFGLGPLNAIALARSAASEQGPDAGIASFAIGMGPALGIAPWIMGWMSESIGFEWAYAFILLILAIATYMYIYIDKNVAKR